MDYEKESLQQPLWHVVVLTILTCTAYGFYWFYKTWRDLAVEAARRAEAGDANPAIDHFANKSCLLRTIGLFVPILNIYLALTLIFNLTKLVPDERSFVRQHPLLCSTFVPAAIIGLGLLSHLRGAYSLLGFTACLPLVLVQSWLNAYWRSREATPLQIRHAFTVKELAAIIIGSLWLGLITAGFSILPPDFERTHQSG